MKDYRTFKEINLDICTMLWNEVENEQFDTAIESCDEKKLSALYEVAEARAEEKGYTIELK